MLRTRLMAAVALLCSAGCSHNQGQSITQQELVRRTQELFDAVASGDKRPWEKYFANDSTYFDERGRRMDKKALLDDQAPLPQGYSGSIKVLNPLSRITGDTAILSYDLDESENVFGQNMKARYHGTDTWVRRNGEWQILAGQMFRYYEDPAPGEQTPKKFPDYTGTYELGPGKTIEVSVDAGHLYLQKSGRPRDLLIPEAPDIFFRKGIEGREVFHRNAQGRVESLLDRRNNEDIVYRKMR
ncbi:MAG TPA: DUF4440 domain-containing protein [Bryobacteraceae bacterium]|jgi:hypothetical protein|nr:DUF4440 domain-containing protein [Bryobacteraceae bacterium]